MSIKRLDRVDRLNGLAGHVHLEVVRETQPGSHLNRLWVEGTHDALVETDEEHVTAVC